MNDNVSDGLEKRLKKNEVRLFIIFYFLKCKKEMLSNGDLIRKIKNVFGIKNRKRISDHIKILREEGLLKYNGKLYYLPKDYKTNLTFLLKIQDKTWNMLFPKRSDAFISEFIPENIKENWGSYIPPLSLILGNLLTEKSKKILSNYTLKQMINDYKGNLFKGREKYEFLIEVLEDLKTAIHVFENRSNPFGCKGTSIHIVSKYIDSRHCSRQGENKYKIKLYQDIKKWYKIAKTVIKNTNTPRRYKNILEFILEQFERYGYYKSSSDINGSKEHKIVLKEGFP